MATTAVTDATFQSDVLQWIVQVKNANLAAGEFLEGRKGQTVEELHGAQRLDCHRIDGDRSRGGERTGRRLEQCRCAAL